jgi:hypothetical protein
MLNSPDDFHFGVHNISPEFITRIFSIGYLIDLALNNKGNRPVWRTAKNGMEFFKALIVPEYDCSIQY